MSSDKRDRLIRYGREEVAKQEAGDAEKVLQLIREARREMEIRLDQSVPVTVEEKPGGEVELVLGKW